MHSRPSSTLCRLLVLLMLCSLGACAATSRPTPPVVVEPVKLTPLAPAVQRIDSQPSQDYLTRVSAWLQKVGTLLAVETPK